MRCFFRYQCRHFFAAPFPPFFHPENHAPCASLARCSSCIARHGFWRFAPHTKSYLASYDNSHGAAFPLNNSFTLLLYVMRGFSDFDTTMPNGDFFGEFSGVCCPGPQSVDKRSTGTEGPEVEKKAAVWLLPESEVGIDFHGRRAWNEHRRGVHASHEVDSSVGRSEPSSH